MKRHSAPIAALFIFIALTFVHVGVAQEPQTPLPSTNAATANPIRTMVWEEAVKAGVNVRYWSALSEVAADREWWARLFAVVTGIFSFVFPFIARQYVTGTAAKWGAGIAETVGVLAFGVSMMSMLSNAADHNELASIHGRWATLKPEFDELYKTSRTLTPEELRSRFSALMEAKQAIVPIEPAAKEEGLMHHAWVEEMHARGIDAAFIAQVQERRKKVGLPIN